MPQTCQVRTYYLQMLAAPALTGDTVMPVGWRIVPGIFPTVAEYRRLYNSVGRQWRWVDRNLMSDDVLRATLADPRVTIWVFQMAEQDAGFIELDGRVAGEVEIAYFGLFPEFVGRGVGLKLLRLGLARAWASLASDPIVSACSALSDAGSRARRGRVWVHTCEWDHPAALSVYLKAGFELYDERMVSQQLPDEEPPADRYAVDGEPEGSGPRSIKSDS